MSDEIDSGIIHALPPAPMFTGRDAHLEQLAATLDDGPGVVSLIGMGGAGKTAIAAEYLHRHASAYARIFVWSFYVDQDASAFLQRAQAYFVSTLAAASPMQIQSHIPTRRLCCRSANVVDTLLAICMLTYTQAI